MSIAASITAATAELSATFGTATCEVRTAPSWAPNPSARVTCSYEEMTPAAGGPLEYEIGNGYGYTVSLYGDVTIDEQDTIIIIASEIAADVGMKLQIQKIPPQSSMSLGVVVETVKR